MSIKFVTFKVIRGVHIESTVHIGYKYLIIFYLLRFNGFNIKSSGVHWAVRGRLTVTLKEDVLEACHRNFDLSFKG